MRKQNRIIKTKSEAMQVFNCRTKMELAEYLGVTKGLISQWPEKLPVKKSDELTGMAYREGWL